MQVHQPIENSERFARKKLHGNLDEPSLGTHHLGGSRILGQRYPVGSFVIPGRKRLPEAQSRHCSVNEKIHGLKIAGYLGGFDCLALAEDPGKRMAVEKYSLGGTNIRAAESIVYFRRIGRNSLTKDLDMC